MSNGHPPGSQQGYPPHQGQGPPQGYQQPPQGYQQPPQGYQQPLHGYDPHQQGPGSPGEPEKKVGFLLGFGIFIFPLLAFITLQKGYSTLAKGASFGWLGLVVIGGIAGGGDESSTTPTDNTPQAAASASSDNDRGSESSTSSSPPPRNNSAPDGRRVENAIPLGTSVDVGGLEATVVNVEFEDQVGGRYVQHEAGEGAQLLILTYRVLNTSNEPIQVLSFADGVINENGVEFGTSMDCHMAMEQPTLGFTETLNPSLPREFAACFEVPAGDSGWVVKFNKGMTTRYMQAVE